MLTTLVIILVLLLLSAFFSGSETALTAASRPVMHQLEQGGDKKAALVNRMHEHKERLIGAILLGNNLVNILASALATSLLIQMVGETGVAYATIGMTLLVLVFSEILPKTYAINNANKMALAVAPVVNAVVAVLAPVTHSINILVKLLLQMVGVRFDAEAAFHGNEEELRGAIELHDSNDESARHERAMLRSILDLNDVQVHEIMTHRKDVEMIDASLPVERIVDEVLASPHTRIPLWRDDTDNVLGVLHAKALLREIRGRGDNLDGLDVVAISTDSWFIPEQTPLLDQLEAFRARREHFALVVDEYGALMGVVTLEDILEEIVGDIDDEHDIDVVGVSPQPDGSYIVDGRVTIRDLNREYEWSLPDEEAATIAGLVLHEARRIPEVGQTFSFHDFRFEILRRQRNQITCVRVTPPAHIENRMASESEQNGL